MTTALEDAMTIHNDVNTIYDKAAYRAIIYRLIQLVNTERRRNEEMVKELQKGREG